MAMIMVSYRRVDQDMAGRIADFLIGKYGADSVFFDVDSIPAGAEYLDLIKTTIAGCEAVVAVIGPNWLRKAADGVSPPPVDYVKIELETARQDRKPIFPVLVNETTMPQESDLPETLRFLSGCNAARVKSEDFHYHMSRLSASIDAKLKSGRTIRRLLVPIQRLWGYGAGATAAGLAGLIWFAAPNAFVSSLEKMKASDRAAAAVATGSVTTATANHSSLDIPPSVVARAQAHGGFIFPDSDRRLLTAAELLGQPPITLRIARNEIYARHGRIFADPTLRNYFLQFSWYQPNAADVSISDLEQSNVDEIKLAEH